MKKRHTSYKLEFNSIEDTARKLQEAQQHRYQHNEHISEVEAELEVLKEQSVAIDEECKAFEAKLLYLMQQSNTQEFTLDRVKYILSKHNDSTYYLRRELVLD